MHGIRRVFLFVLLAILMASLFSSPSLAEEESERHGPLGVTYLFLQSYLLSDMDGFMEHVVSFPPVRDKFQYAIEKKIEFEKRRPPTQSELRFLLAQLDAEMNHWQIYLFTWDAVIIVFETRHYSSALVVREDGKWRVGLLISSMDHDFCVMRPGYCW